MSTYFISDLHLTPERPATNIHFSRFLQDTAVNAEQLFILGDLFEYWIGDDAAELTGADVILDALATLVSAGVEVYFIAGNRDFLIGSRFTERCGVQVLKDGTKINLYGHTALIMHGDSLCTDDVSHQAFRSTVLNPEWQQEFLGQPIPARVEMAKLARMTSIESTSDKPMEIMDVNDSTVRNTMINEGVDLLIHGHTHRPNMHTVEVDGAHGLRVVLGDWHDQASVLEVTPDKLELSASGVTYGARPTTNGWVRENSA